MVDPREISAMASQIMPTGQPNPMVGQAPPQQIAGPKPEDLMALLGMAQAPGAGGPPPDGPPGPPGGDAGSQTKPASLDLVPPGLKEEIAKYAANQQVQMSKQLLALAGPESDAVPAGRKVLLDLWMRRKDGVSDEQIAAWKAEGKPAAWVLANSYPGRYALMSMGHWRPSDKLAFARSMRKLEMGEPTTPTGQSFDPASLETVDAEDPTPAADLA